MSKNTGLFLVVMMAMVLIGSAFQSEGFFWFLFPMVQGLLLSFTLVKEKFRFSVPTKLQLLAGIGSGILIYGVFAIGKQMVLIFVPSMFIELENLYQLISPEGWWQTLLVFMVIIPAEEFFWRGFVQKRLIGTVRFRVGLSVLLYALAHLASGSTLLVIAALVAGLGWVILYEKTKNILVPLLSHLIFDLMLFLLFPLL